MTALVSFQPPFNALVVGAARGIGLGLLRRLLADPQAGTVWAGCREPSGSAELQALMADHAGRLRTLTMDVSDESSLASAAATLKESVHRLDLLINTAGVLHDGQGMRPERKLADVDPSAAMRSFAVNGLGPLLLAKHFVGALSHPQRAVFASLSARVGSIGDNRLGGWYAYRGAKAAQNQFLRTFAVEAARRAPNLTVLALHPGTVATDLSKPFQNNVAPEKLFTADRAADQLLAVIDSAGHASSGSFLAWDATPVPW